MLSTLYIYITRRAKKVRSRRTSKSLVLAFNSYQDDQEEVGFVLHAVGQIASNLKTTLVDDL